MTRQIVENRFNISLQRIEVETLDLLQFHWWDYEDARYIDALDHLARLRDEGKIRHLALTNFDTEHLARASGKSICRSLNRDHTQAALGKVRHLLGEVGLNEPF